MTYLKGKSSHSAVIGLMLTKPMSKRDLIGAVLLSYKVNAEHATLDDTAKAKKATNRVSGILGRVSRDNELQKGLFIHSGVDGYYINFTK